MADVNLVDRMAALPKLAEIPRAELEWLCAHGRVVMYEAGSVLAPKGRSIDDLFVVLSGHVAVRVDRGAGPQRVLGWRAGEVTGFLPYSRMKASPGNNVVEEPTEALAVHKDLFPEMVHRCPVFTAHAVHLMLDRARSFNTSELQDEKMLSLGRLSAGLAHELNNPSSAIVRGAKVVLESLSEADDALRALHGADVDPEQFDLIRQVTSSCGTERPGGALSPMQLTDREDELADWLERNNCDPSCAATLAETAVTTDALDALAQGLTADALEPALRWASANCTAMVVARDIGQAGTRISELVGSVKRFTYMDNLAGPELIDVEPGLRDTIRVLGSKAKEKGVVVALDIDADLPPVRATGSELNQVWMNLLENALDAVSEAGHVSVTGRAERGQVVVRVRDDGEGIPTDVMSKIFDPFFTTKPLGQGTGLGLEITRRLVRRHEGQITVQSRPGETEFSVSFPAGRDVPAGSE